MIFYSISLREEFDFNLNTKVDWSNFCREIAIDVVLKNFEKIGGPGVIVEVDESKFGKSEFLLLLIFRYYIHPLSGKYNKGHRVDGQWVFGGVKPTTGKCFF